MGHIQVSQSVPPVLGNGVYYKDFSYESEFQFAAALTEWIGTFVMHSRAMHLVVQAENYQALQDYARLTAGRHMSGKLQVNVEFQWGRTPQRQWWVTGLRFYVRDSAENRAYATQALVRESVQAQYESKYVGPTPRQIYFDAEKHSRDYVLDLQFGVHIVEYLIEKVYAVAKELAKMPVNPIGPNPDDPWSILKETLGAVVGTGTGTMVDALGELGYEARQVYQVAKAATDGGTKLYQRAKDNNPISGLADMIELGMSLSKVAGPFSGLATAIIGSFVEIAIANQAGPVTRVRSHMYCCFVAGVVNTIAGSTTIRLSRSGDRIFYDYGVKLVRPIIEQQRYRLQLALMEYALRHPIGEWNFNPMYDNAPPFPDAYIRYWSPNMLERALLVQLCKKKYLIQ